MGRRLPRPEAAAPGLCCARLAALAKLRRAALQASRPSGDDPLAGQLRYGIARRTAR